MGNIKIYPFKIAPNTELNIVPPKIRRKQALIREWPKINNNKSLPIHVDLRLNGDGLRLKSRKPPWITAKKLLLENIVGNTKWF